MRVSRTGNPLFGVSTLAVLVVASAVACGGSGGGSGSPTQPPPSSASSGPISLTGNWSGTASDSSGPGQVTWQLTQAGTSFSGTATLTDGSTGLGGRGTVSGTVSNTSIHFSISIPAGGFDSPYAACTAEVSGDGQVSTASITGTFAGSNSCTGAITSGQLTLNKQ
jgi:hypothetical protein